MRYCASVHPGIAIEEVVPDAADRSGVSRIDDIRCRIDTSHPGSWRCIGGTAGLLYCVPDATTLRRRRCRASWCYWRRARDRRDRFFLPQEPMVSIACPSEVTPARSTSASSRVWHRERHTRSAVPPMRRQEPGCSPSNSTPYVVNPGYATPVSSVEYLLLRSRCRSDGGTVSHRPLSELPVPGWWGSRRLFPR